MSIRRWQAISHHTSCPVTSECDYINLIFYSIALLNNWFWFVIAPFFSPFPFIPFYSQHIYFLIFEEVGCFLTDRKVTPSLLSWIRFFLILLMLLVQWKYRGWTKIFMWKRKSTHGSRTLDVRQMWSLLPHYLSGRSNITWLSHLCVKCTFLFIILAFLWLVKSYFGYFIAVADEVLFQIS